MILEGRRKERIGQTECLRWSNSSGAIGLFANKPSMLGTNWRPGKERENFGELRKAEVRPRRRAFRALGPIVLLRIYASSLRAGKIKPTTHKQKEGLTDPHERTAILLAAALRPHRNILPLRSSAKGLRLHHQLHGEGC